ncbi:MAG: hypothetical protein ACI8ZM_001190 [Crocinitomix sp.]|jgi:hypothetical protein
MNPIIRNILAVILGLGIGGFVNMSLINVGYSVTPIPGFDPTDPEAMETLATVYKNLDFKFYVFPFLAHAVGTLVGAIVAGLIAANHKMKFATAIGCVFLLGGIMVNFMIAGPVWFIAADIILAYIPMGWLGGKIALKFMKDSPSANEMN